MSVTINGSTGVTTPGISNSEGYTGDGLTIAAGAPSGAVKVDTSGNLGLGVTPSAWGIYKAIQTGWGSFAGYAAADTAVFSNAYFDGAYKYVGNGFASQYRQINSAHQWHTAPIGTAGNAISFTQAMTLDSSGNLLVGTTSTSSITQGFYVAPGSGTLWDMGHASGVASGAFYGVFRYAGTVIGSITQNGTTAVSYNTSSDYRLKENIQPMTGALAKVAALKPCTYKWKADGSDGEGFIAHELAEVVPQCVTGEKDAVEVVDVKDEDGNVIGTEERPVYQGIDTSFLVATLTAAIQELKAQVDAQAVEIAALKGQA